MLGKIRNRSGRILIGIAVLFAVYNVAGFFIVPYVIKKLLISKLPESLHREVSIREVRFNPYSFTLTIKGFDLKERKKPGTFISFDELLLNLQGRSLIRRALVIKEIRLVKPYVNIIRNSDMSYNFSDLIPKGASQGNAPARAPGLKFSFNNIQIRDGSVDFDDVPKKTRHSVRDISATIPFISNVPKEVEIFVKPSFSANVNGAVFKAGGETKPFANTLETVMTLNLKDLSIPYYLGYAPFPLDYRFKSGVLGANIVLSYKIFSNREPSLTLSGPVELRNIVIQDIKGAPMVDLPSLRVDIASFELFSRSIDVSSIVFQRPRVYLVRDSAGGLNLKALVPHTGGKADPEKTGPSLVLNVGKIRLQKAGLYFSDLFRGVNFKKTLEPVDCTVSDFANTGGKPAGIALSFRNGRGERASVDGNFSINPLTADLGVDISGIDAAALSPYAGEMANIVIARGRASASGRLAASLAGSRGLKASYRGKARLSGFSVLDKVNNEVLLRWAALNLNGIDAGYNPLYVNLKGIALNNFYFDVLINKKGSLNLRDIMARTKQGAAEAEAPPSASAGPRPSIRVNTVEFKGGLVSFKDRHVEPNFSADVTDVAGKVSGMSSEESKTADVNLTAKIDKYAPVDITGRVNPLRKDLFADLKISLGDFDLSSMTPYSGKYVGYAIDKGKLFLDLKYQIEKRKLDSSNKVLIDQLDFGRTVESPVALKLPIRFAMNMLKDREGRIELDIPVAGTLDDPSFSIGGIIVRIIVNLIVKAATSPFALLGQIFGGGQDLGYVVFDPGSSAITEVNAKKLDALTKALYNRPGLRLDIEGFADVKADAESLREQKFMRSLKAEKFAETVKKGETSLTIDDMVIGPKEYERYLWLAYKKGKFRKPTNFLGFTKRLPVPEMEKLLRENTAVTNDDLRALASKRAKAVRDYILSSGKVKPERVFIVSSKTLSPEKKGNLKDSRVDFKLE